jgi:hypothetical protein
MCVRMRVHEDSGLLEMNMRYRPHDSSFVSAQFMSEDGIRSFIRQINRNISRCFPSIVIQANERSQFEVKGSFIWRQPSAVELPKDDLAAALSALMAIGIDDALKAFSLLQRALAEGAVPIALIQLAALDENGMTFQ